MVVARRHVLRRDRIVLLLLLEHTLEGLLYMVTTRIAAIAYDTKSVTVFLVWHAAVVEPACLRFSKSSTTVAFEEIAGSLTCVGAFT